MTKNRVLIALCVIAVIGVGFRLWNLGGAELTFDEGLYAFRSIGYLDYLESAAQPTPVQWFGNAMLPWWTKLSFHDHPPLFFLLQHFFFAAFGDSLLVARLPSALAGIAAIFLMFFIVRRLFNDDVAGLIAAALISVNFAHVFISRLAMMESVLVALSLLNILAFLRFMENSRRWVAFGATFGLVLLTKYVGVFLAPIYLAVIALRQPSALKHWRIYAAAGLALLLFSPVIIYNVMLYKTVSHFDLQFSYLLGKMPSYWQGESGKTQEPFRNIIANLRALFAPPTLALIAAGLVGAAARRRRAQLLLMTLAAISITLLLIGTGSALRFTALYLIPFIPLATLPLITLFERFPNARILAATLGIVIAIEAAFMTQNEFTHAPNYGIAQLDRYLGGVFGNARPANIPRHPNPALDALIQARAKHIPVTLPSSGIIYDDNLSVGPMLWLLSRRQYYHGIPIMPASAFLEAQRSGNTAIFRNVLLYFVKADEGAPLKRVRGTTAEEIEKALVTANAQPAFTATDSDGARAFAVYAFKLSRP